MLTKQLMIVSLILMVSLSDVFSQSTDTNSIYQIKIRNIAGDSISMNDFRGKKILITAFDGSHPDVSFLQQLQSLQTVSDSLVIVAIPANDFGSGIATENIISLKDSLSIGYFIGEPLGVKKENESQHALFKWLTYGTENSHFDYDVMDPNQMFIVSETGVLFGLMARGTSYTDILTLVHRQVN